MKEYSLKHTYGKINPPPSRKNILKAWEGTIKGWSEYNEFNANIPYLDRINRKTGFMRVKEIWNFEIDSVTGEILAVCIGNVVVLSISRYFLDYLLGMTIITQFRPEEK